jgi:hypothetical protein
MDTSHLDDMRSGGDLNISPRRAAWIAGYFGPETQRMLDAEASIVLYLRRGPGFKITMGNILTLEPALTITREEMARALAILEECFREAG